MGWHIKRDGKILCGVKSKSAVSLDMSTASFMLEMAQIGTIGCAKCLQQRLRDVLKDRFNALQVKR